ncbi:MULTISPECIES: nucleotide disphospho-sugar-binding domain-containing protein [Actinokineospora]|uniref:Glycosyl transferase n=1 Tax=Actinokineospora fastidiosa TaxID=1816 RepID=A0A918GLD1_9PSEU|nr:MULTISPECIES: nucleotide disphospho-sugar-binding domain-containing protein [Actinokineospora]UVS78691.1 Glycosyltransferase PerS9 [Actinokineospora sp. UTMC 2448]GGS46205.1 glycosyl transferase [Actinokineospora fastidiosa]
MRVLFATLPAVGHLYPMVPLAWALRAAGHDVLVAVPDDFTAEVTAAGLPAASTSATLRSQSTVDQLRTGVVGREVGAEGGLVDVTEATVDATVALVRNWRPDVVVIEPTARAGQLAAAHAGVPVVLLPWGMLIPPEFSAGGAGVRWNEPGPLERRLGLTEVPPPVLALEVCPPGYQYPNPFPVRHMRYVPYNGRMVRPDWLDEDRRRACVTVSSPSEPMAAVVRELAAAGLDVHIGVADRHREQVLALVGDVAGVRSVGMLPLGVVLPSCAVAAHDGSAGKALTALAHGVPQLVLPLEADQFLHADRVQEVGVGLRADADPAAAVRAVLDSQEIAKQARVLAEEIAAQPSPADIAARFGELV